MQAEGLGDEPAQPLPLLATLHRSLMLDEGAQRQPNSTPAPYLVPSCRTPTLSSR